MVNRVVSTKLTDEEHTELLDACSTEGVTPSFYIKGAIMERLKPESVSDTKIANYSLEGKESERKEPVSELVKLLARTKSEPKSEARENRKVHICK